MASKRRTWPTTTSRACWVRSGSSPRRPLMTSAAAARAVIGERSSWLTSEAKRASRSMRACTASAMSLNELASRSRSGSPSRATRVLEVAGGDLAGGVGDPSERRSRRWLVHQPTPVARSTVIAEPMTSASRVERSVLSVESSWNASK